jgi:hypothetical protein
LLDVYLVRPESSFTSCCIVQGIGDHCGVLLEVEWEENDCRPQVERIVPVYHKANVLGLQTFLRDKFAIWASNGRCVQEVWNNFRNKIFDSIERFIPHKILRNNLDPEYYNKEVKKLKLKVRKAYNRSKLGQQHREKLKRLSKQLLLAKRNAQETFLSSILKNESRCWTEFYKHVKRRKGNRENIPAIKGGNGRLITDSIEQAKFFNFYYSSVFSCESSIPQIQRANSGEPFAISTTIIRKKISSDR